MLRYERGLSSQRDRAWMGQRNVAQGMVISRETLQTNFTYHVYRVIFDKRENIVQHMPCIFMIQRYLMNSFSELVNI